MIDLKNGAVVHARRGDRAAYRPIVTPLATGSDPLVIAKALMELAPFRRLYIADLDSIARCGSHDAVVARIAGAHPVLDLWIDGGETDAKKLARRSAGGPGVPVVGSEAFTEMNALAQALGASNCVLSLDYDASGRMGPHPIYESAELWPDGVIVMTLASVGASGGPDFERLNDALKLAGGRKVYAAGGVRGIEDLQRLADIGVAGALVASALHDGRLGGAALRTILEGQP
ncbi:nickel transporter [Hansschlegelia quercus]|uniref:Nickel transporter n=1 Tax=Hansschlegelia quercus TaxID=2528245 RepID=A0A4Q9GS40_9HYPH|nr:nickel transporter [Hansschlegelia quercus]